MSLLLLTGPALAPSHQHRRVNPGVGYFRGHGMVDVPARNGADDAAHDDLLRSRRFVVTGPSFCTTVNERVYGQMGWVSDA